MRWHIGGKAHEKGGETEGVFGGDTELRLTCSEKDEMGMSEELHPGDMIFPQLEKGLIL